LIDTELWLGLVLVIVIVLATTANIALRTFSRIRLSELLERRRKTDSLTRLLDVRDELLIATSSVRMAAILGLILVVAYTFGVRPRLEISVPYVATFVMAMVIVMVVGVAIPNAWARYAGESFLVAVLPVLFALHYLLMPLAVFQRLTDGVIRRLAGVPKTDEQEAEAEEIEKEILEAVSEGELTGAVHEEDADMIESVMKFRDTDVAEIMTPRTEVTALPDTATLIEVKELIAREGHSRIPVYGENIDDVKGVLYAKDLLRLENAEPFRPTEVMRRVPFVPETKRVADLLEQLRAEKVHLAIVLDEYGGTAGLVTIEDILEEIVGEIADEYEAPEPEPIRRIDENTIEIDARVHIDELNEEMKVELPEDEDYDTVGGFVCSELGKIPAAGEELQYQNLRIHVLDAEERKINRLRVQLIPDETAA
jgi:CBS domain containing-hemolysin-like protein